MVIHLENKMCIWLHPFIQASFSMVININWYYWNSSMSHMKHIRNTALWASAISMQITAGQISAGREQLTPQKGTFLDWNRRSAHGWIWKEAMLGVPEQFQLYSLLSGEPHWLETPIDVKYIHKIHKSSNRLIACAVTYIAILFWINNPLQNCVCANLPSSRDSIFQGVIAEANTNETSLLNKKILLLIFQFGFLWCLLCVSDRIPWYFCNFLLP